MIAPTAIYTVPLVLWAAFSINGFPKVEGGVIVGAISDDDDVFELESAVFNDGKDLEVVWDAISDAEADTVVELAVVLVSLGMSLPTSETDGMKFFLTIFADVLFEICRKENLAVVQSQMSYIIKDLLLMHPPLLSKMVLKSISF